MWLMLEVVHICTLALKRWQQLAARGLNIPGDGGGDGSGGPAGCGSDVTPRVSTMTSSPLFMCGAST